MTQAVPSNNRGCEHDDVHVMSSAISVESEQPNLTARHTKRMKSSNENRGSVLLKPEENEQVFRLIGNRCQCLAAGVCQLYLTEAPGHREWIKKNNGVITLIKDVSRRSFYLRLYCMQRRTLVWEHEVYNSMEYKSPLFYFHTFEAEDCMAAFNFASETDAMTLKNILLEKLNAPKHRRLDKRKLETEVPRESMTLPRKSPSALSPMGSMVTGSTGTLLNGSPSSLGLNKSVSSSFMSRSKKDKKKKKESRLTKDQISFPTDFRHVTHMGWNPDNKGLELDSLDSLDPSLKKMFKDVGISEKKMRRKKMQECIYDFIDCYQKEEEQQEKRNERVPAPDAPPVAPPQKANAPPPIPVRTIPVNMNSSKAYQTRSAPPLPPSHSQSNVPPPSAPAAPPVQRTVPMRPPPPSNSPGAMLPPPPPPPPLPTLPAVPARENIPSDAVPCTVPPPPPPPLPVMTESAKGDTDDLQSRLMESIRSGATLRKINRDELKAPVTEPRSDLLNEIRQGIELKPVSKEPKASPASGPLAQSGVAAALLRALTVRAQMIHSDSEDSTTESSSDDTDWDD